MPDKIAINIADVKIIVTNETKELKQQVYGAYSHFQTSNKKFVDTIFLNLKIERDFKLSSKGTLLQKSDLWEIFRLNNRIIIKILSENLKDIEFIAIFSDSFANGDLFFKPRLGVISIFQHPFDQLLLINYLSKINGAIFHSCFSNNCLFLGSSGAGKSTIAKLWLKNRFDVLSDDRIVLRKKDSNFIAYGTPWHGDANLYSNKSSPLEKIFFLKHGKKNEIKPINPTQAAALLVARSFPPYWDAEGMQNVLNLCTEIAQNIPCYEFSFVPDKSAVDFVLNLG